MNKEEKSKEYSELKVRQYDKYNIIDKYGIHRAMSQCNFDGNDLRDGFETGWDEALKSILVDASKELPEYGESVWVINENKEHFFCHRSNEDIVKTDRYGWCNYTGSDIVAWIRNITFDEIIELNKDVLKRLKDK